MYFSKVMLNPDIIKEENPNKWNMIQWAIKTVHSIYFFCFNPKYFVHSYKMSYERNNPVF